MPLLDQRAPQRQREREHAEDHDEPGDDAAKARAPRGHRPQHDGRGADERAARERPHQRQDQRRRAEHPPDPRSPVAKGEVDGERQHGRQQIGEVVGVGDRARHAVRRAGDEPKSAVQAGGGGREHEHAQHHGDFAAGVQQLHDQEREGREQQVAQRLAQTGGDVAREHQRQQDEHRERDQRRQRRRQPHFLVARQRAQRIAHQQQRAEQLDDRDRLGRIAEHVVPRERGDQQDQQRRRVEDDEAEHHRDHGGGQRVHRRERGRHGDRESDEHDQRPFRAADPELRAHYTGADSGLV